MDLKGADIYDPDGSVQNVEGLLFTRDLFSRKQPEDIFIMSLLQSMNDKLLFQ